MAKRPVGVTEFSIWLRRKMDEYDMTDQQLANRLGTVNRTAVTHWRHSRGHPEPESLFALARVFGLENERTLFEMVGKVPVGDASIASQPLSRADVLMLPVVRNFDEPINVDDAIAWVPDGVLTGDEEMVAARVVSDTLAPLIVRGDVVVADRQRKPATLDIVLVRNEDGQPEVWRLGRRGRTFVLTDHHGHERPMVREALRGIVVALWRLRQALTGDPNRPWGVMT